MWSGFLAYNQFGSSDADTTGNHYSQAADTFFPAAK